VENQYLDVISDPNKFLVAKMGAEYYGLVRQRIDLDGLSYDAAHSNNET
jgi:hypothetical protein